MASEKTGRLYLKKEKTTRLYVKIILIVYIVLVILGTLNANTVYATSDSGSAYEWINEEDEKAQIVTDDGEAEENTDRGVISLDLRTSGENVGFYHKDTLRVRLGEQAENSIVTRTVEAIRPYIRDGFANIWDEIPTKDNLYGGEWAKNLQPFYGRPIKEYSNQPLVLPFEDVTYSIKMTLEAKNWVHTEFMPKIQAMIEEESLAYPLYNFRLNFPTGISLTDFQQELGLGKESVDTPRTLWSYGAEIIDTCYPMTGCVEKNKKQNQGNEEASAKIVDEGTTQNTYNKTMYITNAGNQYGFTLNMDYVYILKGFHSDDTSVSLDTLPVEIDNKKGSAETTAYIVKPLTIRLGEGKFKNKNDFSNLVGVPAVDLKTTELINKETITSQKALKDLSTLGLKKENLILVNTEVGPVVSESIFREALQLPNGKYLTGKTVNLKNYFATGSETLEFLEGGTAELSEYVTDANQLRIDIGENNTMYIFLNNKTTNWGRMVDWVFNGYGKDKETSKVRALEEQIKQEIEKYDNIDNYNTYLDNAGQLTEGTQIMLPIIFGGVALFIIAVVVVIVRLKIRKAKQKQLMFDDTVFDTEVEGKKDNFDDIDFDVF